MNDLLYYFGPTIPDGLDCVPLAYVSAPQMKPDWAIAVLTTDRYAKENYSHKDTITVFEDGTAGYFLDVSVDMPGTDMGGLLATDTPYISYAKRTKLVSDSWSFDVVNTPIKVSGLAISKADSWSPIVQPGVVWRYHIVSAAEPASSWLKRSGLQTDDAVWLIYSVPEYRYGTLVGDQGLQFPPDPAYYRIVREVASPVDTNQISYRGDLGVLTQVKVNGALPYSESLSFTGNETHEYVKSLDRGKKIIEVKNTLGPDDFIELIYYGVADNYVYKGYRDVVGRWYDFDLNPEFGHFLRDDRTFLNRSSADALLQQITLYAYPTAYMKVDSQTAHTTGNVLGSLSLNFKRAVDYGETHFIRHTTSRVNFTDGSLDNRDDKGVNTYGHAHYGKNYYDEDVDASSDTYSNAYPSMLPIARFVLTSPMSIESLGVADIRIRGGGITDDAALEYANTDEDGLQKIKGYYDMATWSGQPVKEGGVVEVQISRSLLKTDPDDTNPETYTHEEIDEIVKSSISPGIYYEIRYVDTI